MFKLYCFGVFVNDNQNFQTMRKGVKHSTSVAKFRKHGHGEAGAQLYLTQECLELLKLDKAIAIFVKRFEHCVDVTARRIVS